jgi:hypothetical protein
VLVPYPVPCAVGPRFPFRPDQRRKDAQA